MLFRRIGAEPIVPTATAFAGPTLRVALFLGFGLICGIWLFAGGYFSARLADLEQRSAAVNARYMHAQESLTTARMQVLLGSVYVRDALLDPNPAASEAYRANLRGASATAEQALQQYAPIVDSAAERERVAQLRRDVDSFRDTVLAILSTDSRNWRVEAPMLLRQKIMPKREGVIRAAEEMQLSNRAAYVNLQDEIGGFYRLTQQRLWQSFGLAVIASFGIALLATIYAGRLEDRIQRQRQKERENARDLQRLSAQLVTAQEEERRHIARELHDEIGQALTAMKVELAVVQRAVEAAGGPVESFDEVRTIADGALQSVRDLSRLLHPALLDDLGLAAAVDAYVRGFAARHGLRLDLVTECAQERLAAEIETAAYRIVQEALTNVVKHAHATSCRVCLRQTGTLVVTVQDDGVGFDPAELTGAGTRRGLGLLGIRERVTQLQGTVGIESAPGKGTRLTVELPSRVRSRAIVAVDPDAPAMDVEAVGFRRE